MTIQASDLIEITVGLVIGLALFPTIQTAADEATANATGIAASLMPLIPGVFVIVLLGGAVAYIYFKR